MADLADYIGKQARIIFTLLIHIYINKSFILAANKGGAFQRTVNFVCVYDKGLL